MDNSTTQVPISLWPQTKPNETSSSKKYHSLTRVFRMSVNRQLALRGHVTNASFKQWVGILLMPKIDRARKNYHTTAWTEIWEETHSREIFMALWFFNKVVWFVLAAMLEGILLPSNMAAKTTFCLYLVKRLIVTLRCAVNVPTSTFQHFPWSLSAKCVFTHFGHVTSKELTHFKKMVQVLKNLITIILLKIWPTNRF